MSDENIIDFPKAKTIAEKQFCQCGNALEMWLDDVGFAFGLCSKCDLGVGKHPIQLNDAEE